MQRRLSNLALMTLAAGISLQAGAEEMDTTHVTHLREVEVTSIKEKGQLREQPAAVSVITGQDMEAAHVDNLKGASTLAPNLFVPNYGSRLTSAIYIRGIGSRINTPAVGLYVDNIPYVDKSAFDFNLADAERIEVMRGPQGTLYGRNTMGGLIRIETKNPFRYEGTDLRLGYASGNNHRNASLTHYHRHSDTFAFSAGGYYEGNEGFFEHDVTGRDVERMNSGGARLRGIYRPSESWTLDMSASYDFNKEGAYPYYYLGSLTATEQYPTLVGKITNNRQSTYRRSMTNLGANLEHKAERWQMNAVTGYQQLKDRMFMDQDFMQPDIYTLEQRQRIHTLSEEVTFKNRTQGRWDWITGANIMYQWLHTSGPVTFCSDGVKWLEQNINRMFPTSPAMQLTLTDAELKMGGSFDTPTFNAALFHQSTYRFTKGLSATLGLRLEYDHHRIDYQAPATIGYDFRMTQMGVNLTGRQITIDDYDGTMKHDYLRLLPKLAVKYDFDRDNNLYLTVSEGMRSGGYNVQMFSDLLEGAMRVHMVDDVKQGVFDYLDQVMGGSPMVGGIKQTIANSLPQTTMPDVKAVTYKPEYSWNFEVGTHLTLAQRRLALDASLFYSRIYDQQIARFAPSGMGRMMVNAGESESWGGEMSVRLQPVEPLLITANYGYTHATFKKYDTSNATSGTDYSGNYVPFVPQHTLSADAQYTWTTRCPWLKAITLGVNTQAAGSIYWTEQNNVSEPLQAQLGARLALQLKGATLTLWGRNLTDNRYSTFYFESAGRGYAQRSNPRQVGIDLKIRL